MANKINLVAFSDADGDGFDIGIQTGIADEPKYVCFNSPSDYYLWTAHEARQMALTLMEHAAKIEAYNFHKNLVASTFSDAYSLERQAH